MQQSLSAPIGVPRRLAELALAALVALAAAIGSAQAAEWQPSRPVRMIIPSGAGGITDILGRVLAQRLTESLGQQVVVDNRPGASGIVGSAIVARAAPDGQTLLMVFPSHPVNPSVFPDMPFDTVSAFAPVTMVSAVSPVLIVASPFPARSVAELIGIGKARPGYLNHGSVGNTSMGHLGAELFRRMAGIDITFVIYKGAPQILTGLLGGEIHFYLIGSAGTVVPQVRAGRVRALGVGARERLPVLPDVPSISETLPGYEARGWNGILAPAGTNKAIVARLHAEIVKVVRSPEFTKLLTSEGATPVANTPSEFDVNIREDVKKWARVIKEAGFGRQ
ncbi:MAG: tripartite tricarboxylate transporter substrate binding protein [Burkholderiales bacterium]|nr:tripartite tricarboxylate transporter substrate binding protein [Burkholderiales bacterium]